MALSLEQNQGRILSSDCGQTLSSWPLARITQLHPEPDSLTRIITLKTSMSTYKRSIAKVCVLPTDPEAAHSTSLLSKAGGSVEEIVDPIDSVSV